MANQTDRTIALDQVRFDGDGLVPAIIQDVRTQRVLMLGYMNRESLAKTLETGLTWFYSRSRGRLWQKGETSGHVQRVRSVTIDCDQDTLLLHVEQVGPGACHEGFESCFHYRIEGDGIEVGIEEGTGKGSEERTFDPDEVYRKR